MNINYKISANRNQINAIGENGQNLYDKMQEKYSNFIKDNKSTVKTYGNRRHAIKSIDNFLLSNVNKLNNETNFIDEESKNASETEENSIQDTTSQVKIINLA